MKRCSVGAIGQAPAMQTLCAPGRPRRTGFAERFALIREDFAGEGGETSEYDLVVGELENDELVDLIYNNLFGRDATEDDGRDFWVNQLDEGESTLATIVGDVIDGIEEDSTDEAIFQQFTANDKSPQNQGA